jgi:hypothetical protein
MGLQRQVSPLPPGRYFVTLMDHPAGVLRELDAWLEQNRATVKVTTTEHTPASFQDVARTFVAFNVTAPTSGWVPTRWGFPNKNAEPGQPGEVKTEGDTVQKPDSAEDAKKDAMRVALITGGIVAGIIGVVLLAAWLDARRSTPASSAQEAA